MHTYYKLPLELGKLLHKEGRHTLVNQLDSIAQKIHLVLITHFDEYRFDITFGCSIWDDDFQILPSVSKWKDNLASSITQSLENHETRLSSIKVRVNLGQEEFKFRNSLQVKKKAHVYVSASIRETNEPFDFEEKIYLSPITLDQSA